MSMPEREMKSHLVVLVLVLVLDRNLPRTRIRIRPSVESICRDACAVPFHVDATSRQSTLEPRRERTMAGSQVAR
jgi:hypothetical protein